MYSYYSAIMYAYSTHIWHYIFFLNLNIWGALFAGLDIGWGWEHGVILNGSLALKGLCHEDFAILGKFLLKS